MVTVSVWLILKQILKPLGLALSFGQFCGIENNFYEFQSSNLGSAYVIGGGVGRRFIEVVIEAQNTLYFNHKAAVYGYN